MFTKFTVDKSSIVYPGAYTPLYKKEEVTNTSAVDKHSIVFPPVNIQELENSFKVEVAITGANREDLQISLKEHALHIDIVHPEQVTGKDIGHSMNGLMNGNTECHIPLPKNADTAFVRAEYMAGILRLFMPKGWNTQTLPHTIVVPY